MSKRRDNRNLMSGEIYHLYNRCNWRSKVWRKTEDRDVFEVILLKRFGECREKLVSYCILENHYHLQVQCHAPDELVSLMASLGMRLAKYINNKYNTVGHLFQDRYKHVHLDTMIGILNVNRYIHLNPIKHGLVKNQKELFEYKWSSLPLYLRNSKSQQVKSDLILDAFQNIDVYKRFLSSKNFYTDLEYIDSDHYRSDIEKLLKDKTSLYLDI